MSPADIRAALDALGLTPTQLARVMGYSEPNPGMHVTRWLKGASTPSPQAARLIQTYLTGYRPGDWPIPRGPGAEVTRTATTASSASAPP